LSDFWVSSRIWTSSPSAPMGVLGEGFVPKKATRLSDLWFSSGGVRSLQQGQRSVRNKKTPDLDSGVLV